MHQAQALKVLRENSYTLWKTKLLQRAKEEWSQWIPVNTKIFEYTRNNNNFLKPNTVPILVKVSASYIVTLVCFCLSTDISFYNWFSK